VAGPLISVAQLAAELASAAPPAVLDARWRLGGPPGRPGWLGGHIPTAAFVDLDTELAAPPGDSGRHPLPDPGAFAAAMRRAGVSAGRAVVVYDDTDASAAARCWWLLRHHGHRDVRVLDGGLPAWVASGRALEEGEVELTPGDFETAPRGCMPVIDAAGALRLAAAGVLLDARAAERYRGELEPVDPVAGHIPGAASAPAVGNLDGGHFRPAARLAERFAALGATRGAQAGAYCGSGVTAAGTVLALELAGVRAALYPGSWSEWIRDPARPVATGPERTS
jgi:thiosulfate/3-mercaptopyruvate sulfurtransferase